jgi:hypothetical protein
VILETILFLSRALSNIVLENKSLLPVRSGMELAYGRQLNQRRAANLGYSALEDIGPIAFCLDFDNNFSLVPFQATKRQSKSDYKLSLRSSLEDQLLRRILTSLRFVSMASAHLWEF